MDEKVYQFSGYMYGSFQTDNGEKVPYCNIFVVSPIEGQENDEYHFGGHRAEKFKATGPDVFKDIKVGDKVELYFNSRNRVCLVAPVK